MRTVAAIVAAAGGAVPPGGASTAGAVPPGGASTAGAITAERDACPADAGPPWLLPLAGRRVAEHAVAAFTGIRVIDEVILALPPGYPAALCPEQRRGRLRLIEGGTTWMELVWRVIRAVDAQEPAGTPGDADETCLLIHDAQRPLIGAPAVEACAAALRRYPAAGVSVPSSDTVVAVDGDVITHIPSRDRLYRRQTPQGFRLPVIRKAYELARADPRRPVTDDCGLVLKYLPDVPVAIAPGSADNIKITCREDLPVAEALLAGHDRAD